MTASHAWICRDGSGGVFCSKPFSMLSVGEEQNFMLYYCAQPKTFPFVLLWYFLYPFEVLCATLSSTWSLDFSSLYVDCRTFRFEC